MVHQGPQGGGSERRRNRKREQEFDKRKEGKRDTVKDMGEIVFVFWNKKEV